MCYQRGGDLLGGEGHRPIRLLSRGLRWCGVARCRSGGGVLRWSDEVFVRLWRGKIREVVGGGEYLKEEIVPDTVVPHLHSKIVHTPLAQVLYSLQYIKI
jgi:hypothetical protein